jgi:hypothetical protein
MQFTVRLEEEEFNAIGFALHEAPMPLKISAPLVEKMRMQIAIQKKEAEDAAARAAQPADISEQSDKVVHLAKSDKENQA